MHLLDETTLGLAILFLLGVLVVVKILTTGSLVEKPKGSLLLQLVNIFNLFFLLIVSPAAAILLLTHSLETVDPTVMNIETTSTLRLVEILGLALYLLGYFLMSWALIRLGRNYQLGGSTPRLTDRMVTDGPYSLVRHPMYTAALSISLGLACLLQSGAFFGVFCIYLLLILLPIPAKERELLKAYGAPYAAYQHKAGRLIPFVH